MTWAARETVSVTTNSGGAATAWSGNLTGRIQAIRYIKDDFADGVDFAITLEATGESLWTESDVNASAIRYPVAPANLGSSGAASSLTEVPIVAAGDRVKIVIANGGNAKSGEFEIVTA